LALLSAAFVALLVASHALAQTPVQERRSLTAPLSPSRQQDRPLLERLPTPPGYTREQLALGDRVFHGEAAGGRCSHCHGWDARGTPIGNDLTTGMFIWADGSVNGIKRILDHNMAIAPGMDGELTTADVVAVATYVWALGRQGGK
jgi:mono/diheme cytochrome c family protein